MFGIGSTELAIILVFGFLLFGPDKLPQMGRTIGRALRQFRETQEKLTSVVQSEVVDPMTAAVNEPTRPRRVDDDDDDTDASAEEAEAPARKETFAERRARLAAEKAAAEQAAQEGDAAEKDTAVADVAATASEPAPAGDATDAASDIAAADTEAESEDRATADLYARRPRKRKAEAGQTDAQDAEASAQPGDTVEGGDR
ncbi:MAG: twin-arginine translocase TatA/TatE family subunit [Collinsella bouchesdurhonensis]|nr:twin-arginine translocase TatA/TatE family subunit [Collinsella bouchesdurhonensis]